MTEITFSEFHQLSTQAASWLTSAAMAWVVHGAGLPGYGADSANGSSVWTVPVERPSLATFPADNMSLYKSRCRLVRITCLCLNTSWWLRQWQICLQGRRPGFDPWVRKILEEGNGKPLQYSCLESSMGKGAWRVQSLELHRVRHDWATNTQHKYMKMFACLLDFDYKFLKTLEVYVYVCVWPHPSE